MSYELPIDGLQTAVYNGNYKNYFGFLGLYMENVSCGVVEVRGYMDEAVRLRIINEAADLFKSKGYKSVTVSEIADRLGMSKKTLYVYFSSKEEMAEAVLDRTMSVIADKVTVQLKREDDPLGILRDTFLTIKEEIVKLPALFLEDMQKQAPALWAKVEAFRSRQLAFIEHLLTRAQQNGQIRDVNPALASAMMMDCIQRMVRPDFAAKHGVTIVEVADTLFAMMMSGLRTDQA
ncbi:TetR/AcrR family transcriptional regulator [Paenibacillus hexagrammi]|uniref:TetR/AcrR family transcriptional regulator n=1 Tax=Paenibacillus hexagrammi TaxID=2908839 RepID=A0ABY3SHZ6_9BACL|nr:TetR/AcrR family transcriptional regulator [Paenibacillus sp. YPD9-1]UJF33393.1 TetR/AcrR family transcriptional regulator [Paenibacillus sp. YPD9-1]